MANQQTFTQWNTSYDPQSSAQSSSPLGPAPTFRSPQDARLAAWGTSPDVQYPDGYLGTSTSNRRQDKLTAAVMRTNTRSYSRGVHKGERINTGDYIWPDEFNLLTGIQLEARGMKFAPSGAMPTHLTNDGKMGPAGVPRGLGAADQPIIDAQRRSRLKSLAPPWR